MWKRKEENNNKQNTNIEAKIELLPLANACGEVTEYKIKWLIFLQKNFHKFADQKKSIKDNKSDC